MGVGESALEPIQLAVRSVIERAVLEMTSRLYHTNGTCAASTDPLADGSDRAPNAPIHHDDGHPITARNEDHANADALRQDPYRYYGSSDPVGDTGLRGSE